MFEAYKIGIRMTLADGVSPGLLGMAARFKTLDGTIHSTRQHVTAFERDMARLKMTAMGSAAAMAVGFGGLAMLHAPLDEARKFQVEMGRLASLGFGDAVNSQAVAFAKGMDTFGTSARDNLTLVNDALAVFKDLKHAEMAAPIMAKMKAANEGMFGAEGGAANERKFMDMLKVIEFRGGLSSDKEFATQADYVQKVISGSRNRVDASQLLQALKTGGVALSRRENESFYLGSEPLIQEFGGQRYGTGAMSIYQNLVQARGSLTAQQELYRLGLIDPKMVEFNKLGHLKKVKPGAMQGSDILEKEGELAFLERVLLPAFKRKGIEGDEAVIREMGMILSNRTGSSLMSRIYQQREQIHKQQDANKSAKGIDEMDAENRKTLNGQMIELHKKWDDVMLELGVTILPTAIEGVKSLSAGLKDVVGFAREHPALTKFAVEGFAIAAAGLAIGGTIGMVRVATMGIGMLGPAIAGLTPGVASLTTGMTGAAASATGAIGPLGGAASALGVLGQAAGVLAAAIAGWNLGVLLNEGVINPMVKNATHGEDEDLGGGIHSFFHVTDTNSKRYGQFTIAKALDYLNMSELLKEEDRIKLGARIQSPGEFMNKDKRSVPLGPMPVRQSDDPWAGMKSVTPPPKQQQTTINNKIVLPDGRVLAEIVTREQAKEAGRLNLGASQFDGGLTLTPPGMRYAP